MSRFYRPGRHSVDARMIFSIFVSLLLLSTLFTPLDAVQRMVLVENYTNTG